VPLISSKLIADIMFSVYRTPLTLGLYTLIICTSPLYVWIYISIFLRKLLLYLLYLFYLLYYRLYRLHYITLATISYYIALLVLS